MKQSRARFLIRLYPSAWRIRYGSEFQTFLESRHVTALEALNIAACALLEHLRESAALIGVVSAITLSSALSFYLGFSDQPHLALWLCWFAIVAAAAACIAPVIRSSKKSTRAVIRGRRIWLYIFAAWMIFNTITALLSGRWGSIPAPALLWLGGRKLVPRVAASMTTPRVLLALIASAMTSSAGAGLLFRSDGSHGGTFLGLMLVLLATADSIKGAHKLLLKRAHTV